MTCIHHYSIVPLQEKYLVLTCVGKKERSARRKEWISEKEMKNFHRFLALFILQLSEHLEACTFSGIDILVMI
jgi:hypothetical protein